MLCSTILVRTIPLVSSCRNCPKWQQQSRDNKLPLEQNKKLVKNSSHFHKHDTILNERKPIASNYCCFKSIPWLEWIKVNNHGFKWVQLANIFTLPPHSSFLIIEISGINPVYLYYAFLYSTFQVEFLSIFAFLHYLLKSTLNYLKSSNVTRGHSKNSNNNTSSATICQTVKDIWFISPIKLDCQLCKCLLWFDRWFRDD